MSDEHIHDDTANGPAVTPPNGAGPPDDIARIRELAELHQSGALTDDEFAAMKAKVLGTIPATAPAPVAPAAPVTAVTPTTGPAPVAQAAPTTPGRRILWFWLATLAIAIGLSAAGYAVGATLFASSNADALREEDNAYEKAYERSRDSAYRSSYDDAYHKAFDSAKTAAARDSRARGTADGTAKGRKKGAAKGKAAA